MNSGALTGARERVPSKPFGASWFLNAIAGAAAFLCTCIALHAFLPAPNVREVGTKMRLVMAKAGNPSHTFNFGANGMLPPERFYVLEQILSMKPRKLKRVFLEMDDVQVTWLPDEQTSQRVLYWHDWKRTRVILRKILNLDVHEQWKRKLRLLRKWHETIVLHLMLFAKNFGNFGRALDLAESFLGGNQIQWGELGPKLDGYFPVAVRISGEKESAYEKERMRRWLKSKMLLWITTPTRPIATMRARFGLLGQRRYLSSLPFTLNCLRNFPDRLLVSF